MQAFANSPPKREIRAETLEAPRHEPHIERRWRDKSQSSAAKLTTSIGDANGVDDSEGNNAGMAGSHTHSRRNQPEDECRSPVCRSCRRIRVRRRQNLAGFARMKKWPRSTETPLLKRASSWITPSMSQSKLANCANVPQIAKEPMADFKAQWFASIN